MGKRIANYRSGDRAENLGIVLLQLFSAVTPVPRQEDFGIFDAVATLLRRKRKLLYAEDSFLVQFKSRTERRIEYFGEKFASLLGQELSLFIAHVDLTKAAVSLYSVAPALAHPNVHDATGLVLYLEPIETQGLIDGVLHIALDKPALNWRSRDLSKRAVESNCFEVIKKWLEIDRFNRRCRAMGMQKSFQWSTNESPIESATGFMWSPRRATMALTDVAPAVQLLAGLAFSEPELCQPVLEIMGWMRGKGVDPDPNGMYGLMAEMSASGKRAKATLENESSAEFAVNFICLQGTKERFSFFINYVARGGRGDGKRVSGSLPELEAMGFRISFDEQDPRRVNIDYEAWLEKEGLECVSQSDGCLLLRRKEPTLGTTEPS